MNSKETSETLVTDFQRNGYVLLREFISGQQLEELQSNVTRFMRDVLPDFRNRRPSSYFIPADGVGKR